MLVRIFKKIDKMENIEQKLPLPPFTLETALQKYNWQKMRGIVKTQKEFLKHIP